MWLLFRRSDRGMMTKDEIKTALKPIAQGLFGKQQPVRYDRPHFKVRSVELMLEDLTAIPPVEWDQYAFSREPLKGRIPNDKRRSYMEKAMACGVEYAEKMHALYGSSDPDVLAEKMGMEVTRPEMPEKADRVLFAEFREPNKIHIYVDALKKCRRFEERPEVARLLGGLDIGKLLLAHELFHSVEERYKSEIYTHTEKIRLWKLGPVHNDSHIIALGEIAAMSFAQHLLGIPYSPYVMDMFLVYGYSPEEASGLYEEMMELSGRVPRQPESRGY